MRQNGKRRCVEGHTVVLETFVGPRPEGKECRHLDGVSGNNRLDNLAWGTSLENSDDKRRHGTIVKGEAQRSAVLTEEKVLVLRERVRNGELVAHIAKEWNLPAPMLRSAANGRKWKHLPGAIKRKPGPRSVADPGKHCSEV